MKNIKIWSILLSSLSQTLQNLYLWWVVEARASSTDTICSGAGETPWSHFPPRGFDPGDTGPAEGVVDTQGWWSSERTAQLSWVEVGWEPDAHIARASHGGSQFQVGFSKMMAIIETINNSWEWSIWDYPKCHSPTRESYVERNSTNNTISVQRDKWSSR